MTHPANQSIREGPESREVASAALVTSLERMLNRSFEGFSIARISAEIERRIVDLATDANDETTFDEHSLERGMLRAMRRKLTAFLPLSPDVLEEFGTKVLSTCSLYAERAGLQVAHLGASISDIYDPEERLLQLRTSLTHLRDELRTAQPASHANATPQAFASRILRNLANPSTATYQGEAEAALSQQLLESEQLIATTLNTLALAGVSDVLH